MADQPLRYRPDPSVKYRGDFEGVNLFDLLKYWIMGLNQPINPINVPSDRGYYQERIDRGRAAKPLEIDPTIGTWTLIPKELENQFFADPRSKHTRFKIVMGNLYAQKFRPQEPPKLEGYDEQWAGVLPLRDKERI